MDQTLNIDAHLDCDCIVCKIKDLRGQGMRVPYHPNAYGLVYEAVIQSCYKKHKEDPAAKNVSARYVIDATIDYGRRTFGGMAAITFDLLGVHTAKDMGAIVEGLKSIKAVVSHAAEEDTFEEYDVDFVKEFGIPEPKGIP